MILFILLVVDLICISYTVIQYIENSSLENLYNMILSFLFLLIYIYCICEDEKDRKEKIK